MAKTEKPDTGALLFRVKSGGYYKRDGVELSLVIGETVSLTPEQFAAFPESMKDKLVPVETVTVRKPLGE